MAYAEVLPCAALLVVVDDQDLWLFAPVRDDGDKGDADTEAVGATDKDDEDKRSLLQ